MFTKMLNKSKYSFVILLLLLLISELSWAQSKWYANTSLQIINSDFQGNSSNSSFYFYNGLRFQTQSFSLGLSVPLVFVNSNRFTQSSDIGNSNNLMGESTMGSMTFGLGDLYLNSSVPVVNESGSIPTFSIDGYIKFPTSSTNLEIGTNKIDAQIALGLRKYIHNFSLFAQFGYLFLGKSDGSNLIDPYTISIGLGYSFGYGQHSILLAYDSYTKIISGLSSPKQLALGYNYMISAGLYFNSFVSGGLNNSSANFTVSGGLNFEL